MTPLRVNSASDTSGSPFEASSAADREVLDQATFRRMITIERKRTERSKEPFLLMLLEAGISKTPITTDLLSTNGFFPAGIQQGNRYRRLVQRADHGRA